MKSLAILVLLLMQGNPAAPSNSGTVTGTLLDLAGKPAAGVRVAAMAVPEFIANTGSLLKIVDTDRNGQYRLENIPPGRYFITAGLVETPTYYPGVKAQSAAKEVQVLAGKTVDKIDFTMAVPTGFRVSGRLLVKPSLPNYAPFVLYSRTAGERQSALQPDGTFEFLRVAPGQYTLQPPFGLPSTMLNITDHDVTNLEYGGGHGVRVTGKLIAFGNISNLSPLPSISLSEAPGFVAPAQAGIAYAPTRTVRPASDGTFEIVNVLPGSYNLRVSGVGGLTNVPLFVSNTDVTGIEVSIPFQTEIPGRTVASNGSRLPPGLAVNITARYANGTVGAAYQEDGSFRFRVAEGEYQLAVRNLPLGHTVQSLTSGSIDLLKDKLIVSAGRKLDEIVLTIAAVPLDSIKGVKFSGRVTGLPAGAAATAKVSLVGADPGSPTLETSVNADGTFEFPKVPSGTYTARTSGIPNPFPVGIERVYVGDDNMSGFQIPLNLQVVVFGRVTVVDQNGRPAPDIVPSATISFRRVNGSVGTSLRPDGTFQAPLDNGDNTISITNLPPQFTILYITAGSVDLMTSPLKVEKNVPPAEIQVRLQFKP